MHYYIDGYNIIFRVLHASETLQLQREALIYDLSYKAALFNLDLTLVFDSHYQEGDGTRSHVDCLEVVYTAKGESADDYIIKAIKHGSNPKQQVVVTSDNRLAWKIRTLGGKTEPAEEFVDRLQRRCMNHLCGVEAVESLDSSFFQDKPDEPELPKLSTPSSSHAPFEMPTLIEPLSKTRVPKKADTALSSNTSSQIPIKSAPPEQCFEYYQAAFEEEYKASKKDGKEEDFPTLLGQSKQSPAPPSPSRAAIKKSKADKVGHIEEKLSDADRWLQAFERNKDKKSFDDDDLELF